jgi:hypothetical protein
MISKDYDALTGASHRQPAIAVGPDLLVRYRSWWVEGDKALSPDEQQHAIRDAYQELSAAFARRTAGFAAEIARHPSLFFTNEFEKEQISYGYLHYTFAVGRFVLRTTAIRHEDRVTLAQIIELNALPDTLDASSFPRLTDGGVELLIETQWNNVCRLQEKAREAENRLWASYAHRLDDGDADALRQACQRLQHDVWLQVDLECGLPAAFRDHLDPGGMAPASDLKLFCDIRSLCLRAAQEEEDGSLAVAMAPPELPPHPLSPTTPPAEAIRAPHVQTGHFWETIKAWELSRGGAQPTGLQLNDRDLVLCTAMEGQAIYAGSLGFRPALTASGFPHNFITYVLIINATNRRQIGRLVDRVNNMGALRLLALRDLPLLRVASTEVRRLGDRLTGIEQDLSTSILSRNGKDGQEEQHLSGSEEELARLGGDLSKIGARISGGLAYRVARSRLYAQSYYNVFDGMRFGRIEGFMPYDEFIRRRVAENFSFIAGLGERHQQLLARFRTAIEQAQGLRLRTLVEAQNKMVHAGHAVEFIAVTYYGGQILSALAEPMVRTLAPGMDAGWVKAGAVFLCFLLWLVLRRHTGGMWSGLVARLRWRGSAATKG